MLRSNELEMFRVSWQGWLREFAAMKHRVTWWVTLLVWGFAVQGLAQGTNPVAYTLLEGSYLIDDCLICGRPTIQQPLRGTFELQLVQDAGTYRKYAVQKIDFTASPGWPGERHITGDGTYARFEEFALLQDMTLAVQIKDEYTNKPAFFTNDSRIVQKPFPLIQINLTQTNGTWLQTFSLQLFAAPVREIWFSTSRGFTSTNRFAPT